MAEIGKKEHENDNHFFECVNSFFESDTLHFESVTSFFESDTLRFESVTSFFESDTLHFESGTSFFENDTLHFENDTSFFESAQSFLKMTQALSHLTQVLAHERSSVLFGNDCGSSLLHVWGVVRKRYASKITLLRHVLLRNPLEIYSVALFRTGYALRRIENPYVFAASGMANEELLYAQKIGALCKGLILS